MGGRGITEPPRREVIHRVRPAHGHAGPGRSIMSTKNAIAFLLIASLIATTPACRTAAGTGAIAGTAGGAAIGGAFGGWKGAAIGAAAGLVVGTAVGVAVDSEERAAAREAARENRVVVREVYDTETRETVRVRAEPSPAQPTQVTTTVTKWNPSTGQWEQVSQSTQTVE
jgi:outer membrane lipoprotein SlyB